MKHYQAKQVLKNQDMQLKSWLVKCVRQDGKYFLLNSQEICSIKLIAELGSLQQKQIIFRIYRNILPGYVKVKYIQTPYLKIL